MIVLNPDDRQFFLDQALETPWKIILIPGPGVDTSRFSPLPERAGMPVANPPPARMLWDKGVGEFVEAARRI